MTNCINLHAQLTLAPSQLALGLGAVVKAVAAIKGEAVPVPGLEGVEPCETAKAIAQSLVDGEKKAIFLGNVAANVADAASLQALALTLGKLTGIGRLERSTNHANSHH